MRTRSDKGSSEKDNNHFSLGHTFTPLFPDSVQSQYPCYPLESPLVLPLRVQHENGCVFPIFLAGKLVNQELNGPTPLQEDSLLYSARLGWSAILVVATMALRTAKLRVCAPSMTSASQT